jgi:D-alanyl-D-alanine carboxypeptidase (penicillin-binding protein 5/6)
MLNSLIAFCLIILGLLPSFGIKNDLQSKLENTVMGKSNTAQEEVDSIKPLKLLPEKSLNFSEISSSSAATLFTDFESGEILFSKNKDKRLPMASITKLMTALIVIERVGPSEIVTVPALSTQPLDTNMGLAVGDKVSVGDLLHGLLITSGADASLSLSAYVGGTEEKFVAQMNERAAKLGLRDTQFTNSVGYDDNGHYSTASDLTKIARIALTNPYISEIVANRTYTATSVDGKKYYLSNTNLLLGTPYYKGIKTGTTFQAGQCLITLFDDGTRKIIGVVLNSANRFAETEGIIEWTKRSFTW